MFSNSKTFSVLISVSLHLLFVIIIVMMYKNNYSANPSAIEIGFGNGEPAGGGGGPALKNEKRETVVPRQEEKIPIARKDIKEKKEKVVEPKETSENSSENSSGNTTGNTTGSGTGSGTGTGSGSGTGSGTGTGSGFGIPLPKVEKKNDVYLVAVDQMPEAIGGTENIESKIPPTLKGSSKGTVYVLAFIDEIGVVRRVLLSKGIGNPYDQAALDAVRKSRFRAGRKQGENVKVQLHLAISF